MAAALRPRLYRLILVAVLAVVMVSIALPNTALSDLRDNMPWFRGFMSWIEFVGGPVNLVHAILFLVLGAAASHAFDRRGRALAAAAIVGLSIGSELLQFWIPGRHPRVADALVDVAAAGLGYALGAGWRLSLRHPARCLAWSTTLACGGLVALPFVRWSVLGAGSFAVQVADVLLVAALGLAMPSIRDFATARPRLVLASLGWLGALALAFWNADNSMWGLARWLGCGYLLSLLWLMATLVQTAGRRRALLLSAGIGATLAAIIAVWAGVGYYAWPDTAALQPLLSHLGSLPSGHYPRIRGLFNNANMLGFYLCLSMGGVLACAERGWMSSKTMRWIVLVILAAAALTLSPAFAAMLLLLAWWNLQRRHARSESAGGFARLLFGLALALAALNVGVLLINADALFQEPSVRVQVWKSAWATWASNPLLGIGLGDAVADVTFQAPDGSWQHLTDAHNILLNVGAQAGIAGVLALGWLVWTALAMRMALQPAARVLRTAALLGLVYLGASSSFEDARILWIVLGLVAGWSLASDPVSSAPAADMPNKEPARP